MKIRPNFHIFTVIYSSLHGFIWNQHNNQLPVGLLAQLVEYCMGIAEFYGFKSRTGLKFFSGLIFTTAQVVFITVKVTFIFTSLSAVQIYDFHIFAVVYNRLCSNLIKLNLCMHERQSSLLTNFLFDNIHSKTQILLYFSTIISKLNVCNNIETSNSTFNL